MHLIIVVLTMVVLPVGCVMWGLSDGHGTTLALIGTWFVFWAAGVRLAIAGVRQIVKPGLTVTGIFGITDRAAFPLAQELGFWNTTIGLLCIASLWLLAWRVPLALASGGFYMLAGIKHVRSAERNFEANTAMISDLWAGAVLIGFAALVLAHAETL